MDISQYLKGIGKDFREEKGEAWISLEPKNLHMVLEKLKHSGFHRLSAISGVDTGKEIELIYHVFSESYYVNVRVPVPKKKLEIKTVEFTQELTSLKGRCMRCSGRTSRATRISRAFSLTRSPPRTH
jgi:hypothetical protein